MNLVDLVNWITRCRS